MVKESLLDQIKEELFGTTEAGQATDDGFLIKLRSGEYDDKQYNKIYDLFSELNDELAKTDGVAASAMAYYTEFVEDTLRHLYDAEDPKLLEVSADLVGMWGRD